VKQPDANILIKNQTTYCNYLEQRILSCHGNREHISYKTAKITSQNSRSFPGLLSVSKSSKAIKFQVPRLFNDPVCFREFWKWYYSFTAYCSHKSNWIYKPKEN